MSQPRLYPVACESKDFALTGYADTIICEPGIGNNDSTLIGIRLGGEPAATQALATVLRTGVPFRITVDGNEFTCQGDKHKYSLQYGAAVPYCEALLTIQDDAFVHFALYIPLASGHLQNILSSAAPPANLCETSQNHLLIVSLVELIVLCSQERSQVIYCH